MKPLTKLLLRELSRRVRACFWLKTFGIPAFMALFFLGYFLILNNPFVAVTVMPLTAVDRFFFYQNSAWILYVSLWIYVQIPPTFIDNRRELFTYGGTAALTSLVGFVIFFFWPTAIPSVATEDTLSSLSRIRSLDTTGNSCPSLHVAFSVFTAVWLEIFLRRLHSVSLARWINIIWCLGIIYSTLGTKQHVFIDTIPGVVLGLAGGLLQAKLVRNPAQPANEQLAPEFSQINPAARKL